MKKIYVGNLPFRCNESELQGLFAAHGAVQSCSIVKDRDTGQSRGFAFVEMANDDEATNAISALHGTQFGGRTLTVNEAKPREGSGSGRGGGGYGGGGGGRGGRGRDDFSRGR